MYESEWNGKPLTACNVAELSDVIASPLSVWEIDGTPPIPMDAYVDLARAIAARLLMDSAISEPGALR